MQQRHYILIAAITSLLVTAIVILSSRPDEHPHKSILEENGIYDLLGMNKKRFANMATDKSELKFLYTAIYVYFDGVDEYGKKRETYPENPQDFPFQSSMFSTHRPVNFDQITTWEELNHSGSAFLFVRKQGEKFTGSSEKIVFIIREGYQMDHCRYAVFEDGHVECLELERAKEIWENLGF